MIPPYEAEIVGVDMESLASLVLMKEWELCQQFPDDVVVRDGMVLDGGTELGAESMTARHGFYNLLTWDSPLIPVLFAQIRNHYVHYLMGLDKDVPPTWIKMWANVLRRDEWIAPHVHATDDQFGYLGGHISVACKDSSTYYVYGESIDLIYESKNVVGQISIFPSDIMHYTSIVKDISPRVTVAFDLFSPRQYDNLSQGLKDNLIRLI
jgi:hypothetical protein